MRMADQQLAEADTEDSLQPSLAQPSHQPVLAAFGNPLLDIIVGDETGEVVNMFGLEKDIAQVSRDWRTQGHVTRCSPLIGQEVDTIGSGLFELATQRPDIEYSGGGCALNTVRVFQWLSGRCEALLILALKIFYAGKIFRCPPRLDVPGRPGDGRERRDAAVAGGEGRGEDGVRAAARPRHRPLHRPSARPRADAVRQPRGRKQVRDRGPRAAQGHPPQEYQGRVRQSKCPTRYYNQINIYNVQVIYVEGYFLSHSPDAALELAVFAQQHKITFVFNLCGEYVCEDIGYVENVLKILPYVDIMFGNKSEFDVFVNTVEAKLETSSSLIQKLRAMITGIYESCLNIQIVMLVRKTFT